MENMEERSGLLFNMKRGLDLNGKPKIYFCAHPIDFKNYFEEISEDIFKFQPNCAIFYRKDGDNGDLSQQRQETLSQMQLFIMPVSENLLYDDNYALYKEFDFAQKNKIPVLPIMLDKNLENVFCKKYGDLQFLDKNANDTTALPYDEKLKKYLDSIIIGDELTEKIRAAFDAYIFLSYRKKDRKEAKKLIHLIYENDFCRDIAVWYDEFLVPGENFNSAIKKALMQCDLFALLVTPNLVNEDNYVQKYEYPAALENKKPLLPFEAEPTDKEELNKKYPNIPDCTNKNNPELLFEELKAILSPFNLRGNDSDSRHNFFMGLAYLNGIYVEKNCERGLSLIESAADEGLTDACEKLVSMYKTGEGTQRNYETAVLWQEKLCKIWADKCQKENSEENLYNYFWGLISFGDDLRDIGNLNAAENEYKKAYCVAEIVLKNYPDSDSALRNILICCNKLGDIAKMQDKLEIAQSYYEKMLELSKKILAQADTYDSKRNVLICYIKMGDISMKKRQYDLAKSFYKMSAQENIKLCEQTHDVRAYRDLAITYSYLSQTAKAQGDTKSEQSYCESTFNIIKSIYEQTETRDSLRDLKISYDSLGDIAKEQDNLDLAKDLYEKSLKISKQLYEEKGTRISMRDLLMSYDSLGDIAKKQGKLDLAQEYYKNSFEICEKINKKADTFESKNDLAHGYKKLGDIAKEQCEFDLAQRYYEKNLEIAKELNEERFTVESRLEIAMGYNNLGNIAYEQGIISTAKNYYEEMMTICEQLYKETGTLEAVRNFAASCNYLGQIEQQYGNFDKAELYYKKFLDMSKQCFEQTGTIYEKNNLAKSYEMLGDIKYYKNETDAAERYFKICFELRKQLSEETNSLEDRHNLSVSYAKLGMTAKAQGKLDLAQEYYEKAFEISNEIYKEADNFRSIRDMAICHMNLGDVAKAKADIKTAQLYYEKLVGISLYLFRQTGTIQAEQDCSESFARAGDIYKLNGNLKDAYNCYEFAIEMCENVCKKTDSYEEKINLSKLCNKMGDLLKAQGQLQQAQKYYEQALETEEKFLLHDTNEAKLNLLVQYEKLGRIAEERKIFNTAQSCYEKMLGISAELYEKTCSDENCRNLAISYERLGHVASEQENFSTAFDLYKKGNELIEALYIKTDSSRSKNDLANSLHDLVYTASLKGDLKSIQLYAQKLLDIVKKINNDKKTLQTFYGVASCYEFLGNILQSHNNISTAKSYFKNAFDLYEYIYKDTGEYMLLNDMIIVYYNYICMLSQTGSFSSNVSYWEKLLSLLKEKFLMKSTQDNFTDVVKCYELMYERAKYEGKFFLSMSYSKAKEDFEKKYGKSK